ncbi:MAG: translational GTPase TypA [Bdellovibrionales bacterium]
MQLRNIAIIAHVDHGKTTLVDELLKQSGAFRSNQQVAERVMDSNDLERERGITILAKATSVTWNDVRINIVDTPGHADFGGEVERILSMVDGVVLLVDSAEGPLPQTKFVLGKALRLGLKPILLINKIDRPDARPHEVHSEALDLFISLDATDEQLEFPVLYASGRQGWATDSLDGPRENLNPLFDLIIKHVPQPKVVENKDGFFKLLATTLEYDNFLGRLLTGRIESGVVKPNMNVKALARDGSVIETARIQKVLAWRGIQRVPLDEAQAGDIVTIAGFTKATVADTLCDVGVTEALVAQPIDPPTIAMTFSVNDSPLAGTEGSKVTSRMIGDRLKREAEGNVAIQIRPTESADAFEVAGRGELQLGVLIETMRREGFELSISRPRVVIKTDENGNRLEPYETAVIDVDDEYTGTVINKMNERKADLQDMRASAGKQRLTFIVPSRGLIGYHSEFLTDTRGTGVMNRLFHSYGPWKGSMVGRRNGVLISTDNGEAVAYAIFYLQERGAMFIDPGNKVYAGMIVGENSRDNDLEINVLKEKKLSNVRASGKDEAMILTPPIKMSLENALSYIQDDELVEVTPKSIRLRKLHLDSNVRKREEKKAANE